MAYFDRLAEVAMAPTLDDSMPVKDRMDALRSALAVEDARRKFLTAAGLWASYPHRADPAVVEMERGMPGPEDRAAAHLSRFLHAIINGDPG